MLLHQVAVGGAEVDAVHHHARQGDGRREPPVAAVALARGAAGEGGGGGAQPGHTGQVRVADGAAQQALRECSPSSRIYQSTAPRALRWLSGCGLRLTATATQMPLTSAVEYPSSERHIAEGCGWVPLANEYRRSSSKTLAASGKGVVSRREGRVDCGLSPPTLCGRPSRPRPVRIRIHTHRRSIPLSGPHGLRALGDYEARGLVVDVPRWPW